MVGTDQASLPVSVALGSDPVVGYSFAYNRVPSIFELEVRNESDAALADLTMVIQMKVGDVAVAEDQTVVLDSIPARGVWKLPRPLSFRFDQRIISRYEDSRRGEITFSFASDDGRRRDVRTEIGVLSANQWAMFSGDREKLSMEALASFVQPRDPLIAEVLKRASAILERTTGSSALEGYQASQSDPARVELTVRAIYQALSDWGISYANPPASWTIHGMSLALGQHVGGQKIRLPREVLTTRLGTCLDTSVLMASCLEEMGLRPVIWIVEGHAFVGCWLTPKAKLLEAVQTDPGWMLNQYSDHTLLAVETTGFTTGRDFDQATRERTLHFLENHPEQIDAVLDIYSARIAGIIPMPIEYVNDRGESVVVEYQPPTIELAFPTREPKGPREAYVAAEDSTPPRIQKWKNALLDLSLNNHLLNYSQERHGIQIAVADGLLADLEDELHSGASFTLKARDDIPAMAQARDQVDAWTMDSKLLEAEQRGRVLFTALNSKVMASRLRKVLRDSKAFEEETGANNLFLSLGTLNWSLDGKALKAPLILVPVRLKGGQRGRPITLQMEPAGVSTPNYSLLEKIKQSFGVNLDAFKSMALDDAGVDVDGTLAALRAKLEEAELHFSIVQTANLALLDFTKFRLWRDLDESWPKFMENSLVSHLVTTPTLPFRDPAAEAPPSVTAEDVAELCPIPADGSQSEAVAMAVQGRTFVIEGPPGTGKSQTITNMLAAALANGQKVLFVAEKRAALDVVIRRMEEAGLGTFCLDVHAKGSKPGAVRDQLLSSLNHVVHLDKEGYDVARLQRTSARRELQRYAEHLHEPNAADFSLWSAPRPTSQLR